ncbi:MAG: HD-GYP domain-containing protein [Chloroflexi bacterium]|nr:HD-GYP domain-containing protein [Chloroflexota bacterium]
MQSLPRAAQQYIILTLVLAALVVAASVPALSASASALPSAVALAALIVLFDLFPVKFRESHFEITMSTAIKLAGILLFDPRIAVLGTFVGTILAEWRAKRAPVKKMFNVAVMTVTVAVQAALFMALGASDVAGVVISLHQIVALVLMATVDIAFNTTAVALIIALVSCSPVVDHWVTGWKPLLVHELSMAPLAAFIVILWHISPWAILFASIPLVLVRNSYQLVGDLQRQTFDALMVLAKMLDERDEHTHRHCELVAAHAREIAHELSLKNSEIDIIHRAAFLHDIGKIGMANSILFKAGALTPEERELAKRHAAYGGDLLKQFPMFEKGAMYVRHHHERWDGRGYPDGLQGESIPLGARILSVADSFQAMIEDRPYRNGMEISAALRELAVNAGTQFDPRVTEALMRAKRRAGEVVMTPHTAPVPATESAG